MSTLFLVRDNEGITDILSYQLERKGFLLMLVNSLEKAKRLTLCADVIILDRLLPDGEGDSEEQIPFPKVLLPVEVRFGSEGITKIGNTLRIAIQRSWEDDPDNTVKLVSYDLETGESGAVRYPTEAVDTGWVGLSEIGAAAYIKKLYRVALEDLTAKPLGKVEGFAIDTTGTAYVVTDNDGVDDSNGETL